MFEEDYWVKDKGERTLDVILGALVEVIFPIDRVERTRSVLPYDVANYLASILI